MSVKTVRIEGDVPIEVVDRGLLATRINLMKSSQFILL